MHFAIIYSIFLAIAVCLVVYNAIKAWKKARK
jgi:hypothetical protein